MARLARGERPWWKAFPAATRLVDQVWPVNPHHPGSRWVKTFYFGRRRDHGLPDYDERVTRAAERFFEGPPREPFFLYVAFYQPHPPHVVEEPHFSLHPRDQQRELVPPPEGGAPAFERLVRERYGLDALSLDDLAEVRATYLGMASSLDERVGRVLRALEAAGLTDRTVVVFTSDLGWPGGNVQMSSLLRLSRCVLSSRQADRTGRLLSSERTRPDACSRLTRPDPMSAQVRPTGAAATSAGVAGPRGLRGRQGTRREVAHRFPRLPAAVPLLVRVPGHFLGGEVPRGRTVSELTQSVDLFPTILELAGVPTPHTHHGQSLAPLLVAPESGKDPRVPFRDAVFAEGGYDPREPQCFEDLVDDPANPLKGVYYEKVRLARQYPASVSRAAMVRTRRWKLVVRRADPDGVTRELYDLKSDPGERVNLAGTPDEDEGVSRRLERLMLRWYLLTSDAPPATHQRDA